MQWWSGEQSNDAGELMIVLKDLSVPISERKAFLIGLPNLCIVTKPEIVWEEMLNINKSGILQVNESFAKLEI